MTDEETDKVIREALAAAPAPSPELIQKLKAIFQQK